MSKLPLGKKREGRGPGRPLLGRYECIKVAVTAEELQHFTVEAAKRGLRPAVYVRTVMGLPE